jgi:HEAT repeats
MIRVRLFALAVTVCAASVASAADGDLAARALQADGWVAWHVPMLSGAGEPCCFGGDGHARGSVGCDLDSHNDNFGTSDEASLPATDSLAVYAHVTHAKIDDVRAYASTCPVQGKDAIRWIEPVAAGQSVAFLGSVLDDEADHVRERSLAVIAYHADGSATHLLAERAAATHPRNDREQALFWLGEARGADGAAIVDRFATTDADPTLREHAIFALSQSHGIDAYARIHAIASSDRADHVRSQALFWMAQMHDPRAAADITATLKIESSDAVREQAVFALSQLGGDNADDALIAVMRGNYPRDVKKHALFWLGQSGSPRAMQFFDEALTSSH